MTFSCCNMKESKKTVLYQIIGNGVAVVYLHFVYLDNFVEVDKMH